MNDNISAERIPTVNGIVNQATAPARHPKGLHRGADRTRELPCPPRFAVADMPKNMGDEA